MDMPWRKFLALWHRHGVFFDPEQIYWPEVNKLPRVNGPGQKICPGSMHRAKTCLTFSKTYFHGSNPVNCPGSKKDHGRRWVSCKGYSAFYLENSSGSAPSPYNDLSKSNTKYFVNFALENYKRAIIMNSSHAETNGGFQFAWLILEACDLAEKWWSIKNFRRVSQN